MFKRFLVPNQTTTVQALDLVLRLWLGWTMISNAPVGITIPLESIGLDPPAYQFLKSLWDTGYLMHATKAIELMAGLALIFNAWTSLALVLLMPVLINIIGITAHFFPGGLLRNGFLLADAVILLSIRFENFRPLLAINAEAGSSPRPTSLKPE